MSSNRMTARTAFRPLRLLSTPTLVGLIAVTVSAPPLLCAQSSWPQFRGSNGSGLASGKNALPAILDEESLLWESPLEPGHSSPVVWGNRIFLTATSGEQLKTVCLDRSTGQTVWEREAPPGPVERVHRINSLASPTPTVDGDRVYVSFGSFGLLCYDHTGAEQWRRPLAQPVRNLFGTASSLHLVEDVLVFVCENETSSFVEALRTHDGKVLWHKPRKGFRSSWSTPVTVTTDDTIEVLVYGVSWLTALDLRDGSDRWAVPGLADEPAITPVGGDGLLFVTSYNMNSNTEVQGLPSWQELLSEHDADSDGYVSFDEGADNKSVLSRHDADGEGDHPLRLFYRMLDENGDRKLSSSEYEKLTAWLSSFEQANGLIAIRPPAAPGQKAEVAWSWHKGVPEVPSPLYHDGHVYLVKNGGIATCLESQSGKVRYQQRLGSGGPYYASPVAGDGKIYAASARGVVTVFELGETLNVLARNRLGERIMATPAIVDGCIYVRTETRLMAFSTMRDEH